MKNKGISLIVLIITCVVIIILATAIIVNLAQTNIIGNANEAVVKQDFKTMQDELRLYKADRYVQEKGNFKAEDLNVTEKTDIEKIIPSIVGSKYENYVVIENGCIAISEDMPEKERTWAMEALGLVKTSTNRPTQDTTVPTVPTTLDLTVDGNKITAVANGSTDDKGTVTYEYSIDNISWQTSGEFIDLEYKKEYTVYARAVDKSGNKSDVIEEKTIIEKIYTSRYYIFEVLGHYRGNCTTVCELDFYDENGIEVEYTCVEGQVYDSVVNGIPAHWDQEQGSFNLYDNELEYHRSKVTNFLYKYGVNTFGNNTTSWARLVIDLGEEKTVKDIKVCVGDIAYAGTNSEGGRTPKKLSIYEVNEYTDSTYTNNIKQRNDDGLKLVNTIEIPQEYTEPIWFSFTE